MSGTALTTRDHVGIKGASNGRSRNCFPASRILVQTIQQLALPRGYQSQAVHHGISTEALYVIECNSVVRRLERAEGFLIKDLALNGQLTYE